MAGHRESPRRDQAASEISDFLPRHRPHRPAPACLRRCPRRRPRRKGTAPRIGLALRSVHRPHRKKSFPRSKIARNFLDIPVRRADTHNGRNQRRHGSLESRIEAAPGSGFPRVVLSNFHWVSRWKDTRRSGCRIGFALLCSRLNGANSRTDN